MGNENISIYQGKLFDKEIYRYHLIFRDFWWLYEWYLEKFDYPCDSIDTVVLTVRETLKLWDMS